MSEARYKVELREPKGLTVQAWRGKASPERLAAFIDEFNRSMDIGGSNHYIVRARGYKPLITSARIVTAKTGKVVAEWKGYTIGRFN